MCWMGVIVGFLVALHLVIHIVLMVVDVASCYRFLNSKKTNQQQ